MNDRDLESRLRSTLRAEADQADPGALSERVYSIPARVESRWQRWWRGLGPGASRRAGPGGTQFKGGMGMSSALRVAAVVAALTLATTFAINTVSGPDEPLPAGAETATRSEPWVGVTGSGGWSLDYLAHSVAGPQQMSDPRVSGDTYATWSIEYESASDVGDWTIWGPMRITNEEGAWEGEYIAFVESDGQRNIMAWMEGSRAYADLSYIQHAHGNMSDLSITGLVYSGSIPPTVVLGMDGPLPSAPPLPEG